MCTPEQLRTNTALYQGALNAITQALKHFQELCDMQWEAISTATSTRDADPSVLAGKCLFPNNIALKVAHLDIQEAVDVIYKIYDVVSPLLKLAEVKRLTSSYIQSIALLCSGGGNPDFADWTRAHKFIL